MVSPDVVGIGSEYFYLSCAYIYVRLIMSGHLFFCIYFNVRYITCYPKWEEALDFTYKVIGEVLVLGLLVVVYKIPYSSCMWTRQDVIGVFPSYYCLSGATCVPKKRKNVYTWGERRWHLSPRLVQNVTEGKTSQELSWKVDVICQVLKTKCLRCVYNTW